MSVVMRLVELFAVNKRLNDTKPYVLRALSGLAIVILLGVFATVMAALLVAALLWLIYTQILAAGVQIATAALVTGALSLITIAIAAWAAFRVWSAVCADVERIFQSQTPVVNKVADGVGHIAESFVNGLRKRG